MYAPPLGIAIWPLTSLELGAATKLWYLIHVAVLAGACALMPVSLPLRLSTFGVAALSFAVIHDIVLGNVSVLLLLPLAAAWRWLDQPKGSIAQAMAMSVRPMLGVLLIWQLFRRRWRAVAWTIGAGIAIVALTLPAVGVNGYLDYITVLRNLGGVTGVEFNYDLSSSLLLLGVAESVGAFALLGGFVMAVAAIALSLRRDSEVGFMVTITASLLLSPLLWDHYLAMLVLPAAFLASRGHPWALALPMLSWLPGEALPFLVLVATWLPFLARDTQGSAAPHATLEPIL
ncbi:MAG: glycosyltransferase 87 family protein [Candidatus Limnocylindrales bacterium]